MKTFSSSLLFFGHCFATARENDEPVNMYAEKYLLDFRQGGNFQWGSDIRALTLNFRPEPTALYAFRKELNAGTAAVRENIVQLLKAIGLACDVPSPEKIRVIRDHSIIQTLLIDGFAQDDMASSASAQILLALCRPADLAAFNRIFLASLEAGNATYLLLTAKAKTNGARVAVENLAKLPAFRRSAANLHMARVAMAALGNNVMEDDFIAATVDAEENAPAAPKNRFYDVGSAKDGGAVAARLAELGQIGTQRSLLTVCGFLRSPLKSYVTNLYERSIRYDAVDAIRFNFPDERILYKPEKLREWVAVEQFCSANLSAVFDGPTPDLPRDKVYPMHSPP